MPCLFLSSLSPEAYILDQMTPEERDAFEAHYFDCTECTAAVLEGATVAEAVREGAVR